MHLLTQAKNNVAAIELIRHLGVSYKTAWLIKLKLLQIMAGGESSRVLEGRVEIDDSYLGGERSGKRSRGSENKVSFVMLLMNVFTHPSSLSQSQRQSRGKPRGIIPKRLKADWQKYSHSGRPKLLIRYEVNTSP